MSEVNLRRRSSTSACRETENKVEQHINNHGGTGRKKL